MFGQRVWRAAFCCVALALLVSGMALAAVCDPDELPNDTLNCGACGNDCSVGAVNAIRQCRSSACFTAACQPNFYDLDSNGTCEYACNFQSVTELCNGIDDNCNGQIDEGVVPPSPRDVCGVSPSANAAECTTSVAVSCQSGQWACSFPANVCTGGNCASTVDTCDALDNNCNGVVNETQPLFGKSCASDDGLPVPGHGQCRTTGTYVCNGPNNVVCNAIQANCASLPGGCTEICDGADNDCDGSVDETFNSKGANASFFMKPAVTKIASSLWVAQYEASRPNANTTTQGFGNGFATSAPAGQTIDRTPACSEPGSLPWTNLTAAEAEQVCTAAGGSLCQESDFVTACQATASCVYPYNPRGSACTQVATGTKFCNIGAYDYSGSVAGDQDGLLVTADPGLLNCWADWSGLQGNTTATSKIFDLGGNARELVKVSTGVYKLLGASNLNRSEAAAQCTFSGPTVDANYRLQDTGFRCCFTSNPTL